jgi:hypothetical protein
MHVLETKPRIHVHGLFVSRRNSLLPYLHPFSHPSIAQGSAKKKKSKAEDIAEAAAGFVDAQSKMAAAKEQSSSSVTWQPQALKHPLKDYQLEGLKWMATLYENGLSGILADESKHTPTHIRFGCSFAQLFGRRSSSFKDLAPFCLRATHSRTLILWRPSRGSFGAASGLGQDDSDHFADGLPAGEESERALHHRRAPRHPPQLDPRV